MYITHKYIIQCYMDCCVEYSHWHYSQYINSFVPLEGLSQQVHHLLLSVNVYTWDLFFIWVGEEMGGSRGGGGGADRIIRHYPTQVVMGIEFSLYNICIHITKVAQTSVHTKEECSRQIFKILKNILDTRSDYLSITYMSPRITQACTLKRVHNKPLKYQVTIWM